MGVVVDRIIEPIVAVGITRETPTMVIPGIVTGAAYAAGDAVGTMLTIPVPGGATTGVIHGAVLMDRDDEGIELELVLFNQLFTATADNSAFAVSDADLDNFQGSIIFSAFRNYGNNQVCTLAGIGLPFIAPKGVLYAQAVTAGAPNIAAGQEYKVRLKFLLDG